MATTQLPTSEATTVPRDGPADAPIVDLGDPLITDVPPEPGSRIGAIVVWALLGTIWTAYCLYGWIGWALSDNFTPAPKGPESIPTYTLISLRAVEIASVILLLSMGWRYIVAPIRKHRRLSPDGMMMIGCTFAFFLDPVINVFRYAFAWNAYDINLGSWGTFIPHHAGSQRYGEGLLWAWPDYIMFGLIAAILGCRLILWLRRRYPRLSTVGAFAFWFVAFFLGASLIEFTESRLGIFSYSRVWSQLSFFDGRRYQWPVYSDFFTAICCTCFTYLRWSWLTRGRSFLDSGLERFSGAVTRQLALLFAVIGFSAAVWGVLWFGPMSWLSVNADSVAALPSYMQVGR